MARKKLTEVCDIQYGYPFDASRFSSSPEDGMPLIRIRDVKDGHTETYFKGVYPKEYTIHRGDYLVGMDGEFNIAAWQSEDALLNQRVCKIESKSPSVSTSYLYRFLRKELKKIEEETPFVTVKHLSAKRLNQVEFDVPSLEEQERIVAELDLLTGIIDKQKAQLKELDTLAQSIFYDMFGNPVDNSKGWLINKLEDNCEVSSAKRVLVEDVVDSGIPFIRSTELTALNKATSSKDVQFTMFITPEHYEKLKLITGVPKQGDILIPSINSEGISWIVDTEMPFYFKDGRVIWVHVNPDVFASEYLKNAISVILKANYEVLTSGATFLELKLFIIRELMIPIPPLEFQRGFAQKIQSIEQQKESINHSIAETQKLFDYTMDKYFG